MGLSPTVTRAAFGPRHRPRSSGCRQARLEHFRLFAAGSYEGGLDTMRAIARDPVRLAIRPRVQEAFRTRDLYLRLNALRGPIYPD